MGIIRVAIDTVKGTIADQYLESIVPYSMDSSTIMTPGIMQATNRKNNKGASNIITNGSLVQVGENQTMLLVDGGKIIDYTAEAGYFEVSNESAPSLLNGEFGEVLLDAFTRLRFAGSAPQNQQVYYVNTQEVRNIPFGTQSPINYFDTFYNADLYIRAHGYYSIRVTNPLKFYAEMAPRDTGRVTIEDMQKFALSEFLTAFQTAIGKMSMAGEEIRFISAKTTELAKHMQDVLDDSWEELRGFRIESVGISNLSYDERSQKLLEMRSQGAMLADQSIREGYTAGATARGMEAAGANPSGSGMGVLGMGMMSRAADEMLPKQPQPQPQPQQTQPSQGKQGADAWQCATCDKPATGKFCSTCGSAKPGVIHCTSCGAALPSDAKFCSSCGKAV